MLLSAQKQAVEPQSEEVVRTMADGVLTPIPGDRPAGIDARAGRLWVELMKLRPKPADGGHRGGASDSTSPSQEWAAFRDALVDALSTTTKDLELGLFLTEANARVYGFEGLRDALWMLGGLITSFISQGLHPRWEDGDLGAQAAKLYWLNEKLPDIVSDIPLTQNPDPGPNYSLSYFSESRREGGMITAAQFDEAAAGSSIEEHKALADVIVETKAELVRFKVIANHAYGPETPSFSDAEACLDKCGAVMESVLRKLSGKTTKDASRGERIPGPASGPGLFAVPDETASASSDAWRACEALARGGNTDSAIASMAALAAREPNGRVRFQRKLMLADLCLQTNRKQLGTSILEELDEIIQNHKLDHWETSEVVGGIWTRLVRCYRDKSAGTQDTARETEFFFKLSRLDPWQAVACGEPRREE